MSAPVITADHLYAANADAAEFFRRGLLGPDGSGPREYLTERGFGMLLDDTRWSVGYAPPGWTRLHDHLASLGYSDSVLDAAGLACATKRGGLVDVFRDRITFGVRDEICHPTGFVGRRAPNASPASPKYLNTRSTAIYNKPEALFGIAERRRREPGITVVCEGPLDAIAFDLAWGSDDRAASLATCGTAISHRHASAIAQLGSSTVVLAFDPDSAGSRALAAAYQQLPGVTSVRAWRTADALDPADHLARLGKSSLIASIETDTRLAADEIVDRHFDTWPNTKTGEEAKLCLLREVLTSVRDMHKNDIARQVARISWRLDLPYEDVTGELLHSKLGEAGRDVLVRNHLSRASTLRVR